MPTSLSPAVSRRFAALALLMVAAASVLLAFLVGSGASASSSHVASGKRPSSVTWSGTTLQVHGHKAKPGSVTWSGTRATASHRAVVAPSSVTWS